MLRRLLAPVVVAGIVYMSSGFAEQPQGMPRVEALIPSPPNSPYELAVRDGLQELGYVDGQNIKVEWRRIAETDEELKSQVAKVVRAKSDLIIALNTPLARSVMEATTLPVVFLSGDPVATHLAASLGKPGGNGTGVSIVLPELTAKRLELLHEIAPGARRFVYLMNVSNPVTQPQLEIAKESVRRIGVQLLPLNAHTQQELDTALDTLAKHSGEAFAVTSDTLFYANQARIARAVRKAKLPAIFPSADRTNLDIRTGH